jgi:hypothetical protein
MLRILCFHGFATNAQILDYQLRQYKKFYPNVEFVTFNGPHELDPSSIEDPTLKALIEKSGQKCYSWIGYSTENLQENLLITIEHIHKFIEKNGNFDGFLGFSQGGAVCCYYTHFFEYLQNVKQEKPNKYMPKFLIIMNAGSYSPIYSEYPLVKMPSVHFVGEKDFLYLRDVYITTKFVNPVVIFTQEGHKIAKLTENDAEIIKNFLEQFIDKKKINKKSRL